MPEKRLQRTRDSYIMTRCWFCKQPVVPKREKPWPKYDLKYDMWMCSPEHAPSGVALEMEIRALSDLRQMMSDVGPRALK